MCWSVLIDVLSEMSVVLGNDTDVDVTGCRDGLCGDANFQCNMYGLNQLVFTNAITTVHAAALSDVVFHVWHTGGLSLTVR